MELLTVVGDHVPVIPLVEVVGNVGTVAPSQKEPVVLKANVGSTIGLTVTTNDAVVAHCPAFGVKIYVSPAVLLTVVGDHVPVILLVEVVGKEGTLPPEQIVSDVPKLKVGLTGVFTVTANVCDVAHCPAVGVKI